MKKLIQFGSLLGFLFAVAFSANAQSAYYQDVTIPFAFEAGDRTYSAGTYAVRLNKLDTGSAMIVITDPKTEKKQLILASRAQPGLLQKLELVFENTRGRRVLSRIITPGGGFVLAVPQPRATAAKVPTTDNVAVVNAADLF